MAARVLCCWRRATPYLLLLLGVAPSCWAGMVATHQAGGSASNDGTCLEGDDSCQASSNDDDDVVVNHLFQPQIDWIRHHGGFVSGQLEFRKKNDYGDFGIFVTADLEASDLLLSIPLDECVVSNEVGLDDYGGLQCGTIETLLVQTKRGNESSYAPFLDFWTSSHVPHGGNLPSTWSPAGKDLLVSLLGGGRSQQTLPPEDPVSWLDYEWHKGCRRRGQQKGGSDDDETRLLEEHLAMLTLQRGYGELVVPLLDTVAHSAAPNVNHNAFDMENVEAARAVRVVARHALAAGTELTTDYGERMPELLRDCGIVPSYPQLWSFAQQEVHFRLLSEHEFAWDGEAIDPEAEEAVVDFFQREFSRLQVFADTTLADTSRSVVPAAEWKVIVAYHAALTHAMERLLDQVEQAADGGCLVDGEDTTTCNNVSPHRYNLLNQPFDDGFISTDTCDQEKELDHSHYTHLETIQSQYQKIEFVKDPDNQDMCFQLDNIFQICTKYRPHYHEPVVHYSARFLDRIERVIFIGGGDSMLLHELLKYDTLQIVVGLEIDQKVTRNSFKYFGTQPHWDQHDKVQWWYGDAAKSLLLLPSDYFGTFDMVLVDLSETVMSSTVTKGLDIMSALSLLLKPNGIFLKNEMYFRGLSNVFRHSIQLHYYDVPLVCSQCLVLGSNKVDFIHQPLKDHGVETIHAPIIPVDHDFELVHDYMTNPASERHCKGDDDGDYDEPVVQERSPGIVMVLEAENASVDLSSPTEILQELFVSALMKAGLHAVTSSSNVVGDKTLITIILREGYVIARTWPKDHYCAFDIHLWSRFEKQEGVKKALLDAIGSASNSASSFRIAAGGMFGVSTWKEDEKLRGPRFTQDCNDDDSSASNTPGTSLSLDDATIVSAVLEETMEMLPQDIATVAVVCGPQGESCQGADILAKHTSSVEFVVPLWTCENIKGGVEYQQDGAEKKFACEKEIYATILKATSEMDRKLGAIVLDSSASFEMAQIVLKIASRATNRRALFADDLLAMATSSLDPSQAWRKHFVDYFREYFDHEPGFKANALFNNTNNESLEVTTFSSGDKHFISHLRQVTANIEKRTGLVGDIRHIGGVEYEMQHDFQPTQFFNATDYDRTEPYRQWLSQQPVGMQIIFQLEVKPKKPNLTRALVSNLFESALKSHGIDARPSEFEALGDGSVHAVSWSGGNVVVLFNGRDHVDVNLFTYEEDFEFARGFAGPFTATGQLNVALRDEMPRGHGRVVNFLKEVEPRHEPHWAFAMEM